MNPTPLPLSDLAAHQRRFTQMIGELIAWAYAQDGYALTFGEAWRTPEQAELDARKGIGIRNSLHTQRLAVDFNLFIGGAFQTTVDAYRPMGEFWESIGGTWGGRFERPDSDHFSLGFGGVK